MMDRRVYTADALLLLTAFIWGTAFVVQRAGMEHVGPFTFTGIRFALASIALLPIALRRPRQSPRPNLLKGGVLAGAILFCGASLQQIGLIYTTAGKAGFITGLYVIIVPFLGLFAGLHISRNAWSGAILATLGLYLLSIHETLSLSPGDLLVFIGAFFWAFHILLVGRIAPRHDAYQLATTQFVTCAILGLITAILTESITLPQLESAAFHILYGGLISVGIGYTLQVRAQRSAPETHVAIILSFEAAFAVLAGWAFLNEILGARELTGCALMLSGMLIAQFRNHRT